MMDTVPLGSLMARRATEQLANSGRPDAPVVPDRAARRADRATTPHAPRAPRVRTALAFALHRAADAVAPACVPGDGPHATAH